MKRFIITFFLLISSVSLAEDTQQHWICHQSGLIGRKTVIAISNIFQSYNADYTSKEEAFAAAVSKQFDGKFLPQFEPRCEEYSSKEQATQFLKMTLEMLQKKGLQFFWIKFPSVG